MNNNNFKKIQILGNTQVSGHFVYCRLVNYENMTQCKTIKDLVYGGPVGLFLNKPKYFLNTIHHDDLIRKNNIGLSFDYNGKVNGKDLGDNFYNYSLTAESLYGIPFDASAFKIYQYNYILFSSSNKSYSHYIYPLSNCILDLNVSYIDSFKRVYLDIRNQLKVAYIDFCISTNVPLVMEYLGEIEVMQSDNKTNVNNSYFIINRYDENPL